MARADDRFSAGQVRDFARQLDGVDPPLVDQARDLLTGDQPDEFYAGLLSGLCFAHLICTETALDVKQTSGIMAAAVADLLVRRGAV